MKKVLSVCITLLLCIILSGIAYAEANRSIKLSFEDCVLYVGKQQQITAKVERISDDAPSWTSVKWSSSDEAIAKIDGDGFITGKSEGTAIIQAYAKDDPTITQTATVEVRVPVSKMKITTPDAKLLVGSDDSFAHIQLDCVIEPSNAYHQEVLWSSSNEKVATVDENGYVTALSRGSATITAKSTDPTQKWLSSTCQVSVGQSVTEITLNTEAVTVPVPKTVNVNATVAPSNATNQQVIWTSSNEEIATVSAYGAIKGIAPGDAIITATAKDGSGVSSQCMVTVVSPVTKITIEEKSISMPAKESLHISATVEPENASIKEIVWSSSDEKTVIVDRMGIIHAINNGHAIITAAATDGSNVTATINVTVEDFDIIFQNKSSRYVSLSSERECNNISSKINTGNVKPKDNITVGQSGISLNGFFTAPITIQLN